MIVLAKQEHLDALVKLEQTVFDSNNFPLSKSSFRRFISNNRVFVYLIDDKIAGYLLYLEYKHCNKIYSIAVDDNFRGKGISKELINQIIEVTKESDKRKIYLEVRCDNIIAIKLYEKIGFKIAKILKEYYNDACDGYKMELILKIT